MLRYTLICMIVWCGTLLAQPVPAVDENIPFLVTFGKDADAKWGDDDNCQIFFFTIPQDHKTPVFIRIYDPDCGGKHDEQKGSFNSKFKFTLYGTGCYSDKDEENKDPVGNYKSGKLLFTKTFGESAAYDGKWYTFGPVNPVEGELQPELGGYVFKLIAEGISGDDGNLYRYFLSSSPTENKKVEGGNAFTYEYSFRLNGADKAVAHIYPYIDQNTVSFKQHNFDFDGDAYIKVVSMSHPGFKVPTSNDKEWISSQHPVEEKDKKTCLDVQIIKTGSQHNNNAVFYITNQYGKFMPFHAIPIGAIPKKTIGIRRKR